MTHTITLSRPFYNTPQDLNYACYKNKKYAFRFDNLRDRYDFLLKNNFVTREQCTPEFMETCINFFTPDWCLKQFIKILGEDDIPESIKIYAMQRDIWGGALGLLQHPSNAIIDAALKTAGQAIRHIPKHQQTNHQKLLAIQYSTETPELIREIDKPTTQMKKIHVAKYLEGIDYIPNPNEEIKLAAAKSHGIWVLKQKNMQHASEQVILTAIQYTLCPELDYFLKYIPHPNQKILCAIRHQINMVKAQKKQQKPEPTNNAGSCINRLDYLRQTLFLSGHIDEVIKIENNYYRDKVAQIKALNELYEQTRINPFIECHNQEILHPQRS